MRISKSLVWMVATYLFIPLVLILHARAQNVNHAKPPQVIFSATPAAKGVVYKVDNVTVSDPLREFGKAIEKYGDEAPVACLIDSRLPMRLAGEAAALAAKAGFKNVRTFAVDHGTGKVSEIKFGPWTSAPN